MSDPLPPLAPFEAGRASGPGRSAQQSAWMGWLPGLQTLRHYEIAWLRHDIAAGVVLTALLVPVGIAYVVASGVPPISGLYATIFGLLAYALFGPSLVLVLGPDSSLVAPILGVVLPPFAGDPHRAVALAGMMALVSGTLCALAGVARLGCITEVLSKPIRYGYMNGIALTLLIGQLPALFGLSVEAQEPLSTARAFAKAVLDGKAQWASMALGGGTLTVLCLLGRSKRIPAVLVAVAGATLVVTVPDLAARAGVPVLGALPRGLPGFAFPAITANDIGPVLLGGLALALVSFADTSVLSRTYAARERACLDPHQGGAGCGQPRGRPLPRLSSQRQRVAHAGREGRGCKDQLASIVGALVVAALLMFAPTLLENLPTRGGA